MKLAINRKNMPKTIRGVIDSNMEKNNSFLYEHFWLIWSSNNL